MQYEAEQVEITKEQWVKINSSIGKVQDKLKEVNGTGSGIQKTTALQGKCHKATLVAMGLFGCVTFVGLIGKLPETTCITLFLGGCLGLMAATIFGFCTAMSDIYSENCFLYKIFKKPQWVAERNLKLKEYWKVLNTECALLEDKYLQFQLLKFFQEKMATVSQDNLSLYQEFMALLANNLEEKTYNSALLNIMSLQLLVGTSSESHVELSYYQKLENLFTNKNSKRSIRNLL